MNVNKPPLELFERSSICLDWLSIYCIGSINDTPDFKFTLLDFTTRQFTQVHDIYFKNRKIGISQSIPSSTIINKRAVIVKFENEILYSRSAPYFIEKFLRATKLFFKSITRADLARDFHTFENNYHPQIFIRDFFAGNILKNCRGKFQAIGEQKQRTVYDYLSFGSRTTGKRIYLYNKSKELKEKKDKPYIKWFWENNGINSLKDVWRLEFSFKGSQNKIVDTLSGIIDKIHWRDLFKIDKMLEIFTAAINNLFQFKINDNTKNKSRMKTVNLFNDNVTAKKLIKLPDQEIPTRKVKILLKNLVNEHNLTDENQTLSKINIDQSIRIISLRYNMSRFVEKVLNYRPSPALYPDFEINY